MKESERDHWEQQAEIIRSMAYGLGEPGRLFHEQRRNVMGLLEQGIKSSEEQWWQRVLQLLWQEKGPLARQK